MNATVDQLPEVLAGRRAHHAALGQRATFQRCKALALSFASHTYGRHSGLWIACANVRSIKDSSHVHTGQARAVVDVVAAVKQMDEPYASMFWTMCLTGAGNKEFLRDGITINDHSVTIHGQKNKNRVREVPLVYRNIVQPSRHVKAFRLALHRVEKTWTLYDARRSFQHWCEMASIPEIRFKTYAGHRTKSVSEKYRTHDTTRYLIADGALLRAYIEKELNPVTPAPLVQIPDSPF